MDCSIIPARACAAPRLAIYATIKRMTELRIETYTLPGARLGEENPLPFFRDPRVSLSIKAHESLPPEKREYLGWETALRVLPYRMQDEYTRQKRPIGFRAAVLENEYLRATFLPEVGGRLVSLIYRPLGRELLHRNPVFQPANLAIRNAWFSGGIEWNVGQYGHAFSTCSPVFAARIEGPQGEPGLRLYEFERCKRLFWQIDFYLPPGLPFLAAHARVINPNDEQAAMYYWTNIAVDEDPLGDGRLRVLAPATQAIYHNPGGGFGLTDLPGLPSLNGADGTYPLNSPFANEFFFQCDSTPEGALMPWEAALDARGTGLIEASTARLKYRKLFVWGTHPGGRHWQEFLAEPGQAYCEIQGGLAPTQVHGLPMPPRTTWDWTQVFGYLEADPAVIHGTDWNAAWRCADAALKRQLPVEALYRLEETLRAAAAQPPLNILQYGSGWGALELERRARHPGAERLPLSAHFPRQTMGAEQEKWLSLLEQGELPEQDPALPPGEWMVQPEWEELLDRSIRQGHSQNWYAWLHLGVMRMERFDDLGAEAAWNESIRLRPSLWAYRNLAELYQRREDRAAALRCYQRAWELAAAAGQVPTALAVEYLQALLRAGQYEVCAQVYHSLPPAVQHSDRVQILRGQIALYQNDLDALEEVLGREYAVVREGEVTLTDLWFELHARREAQRLGRPVDDDLRRDVKKRFPPPAHIDFRSVE